MGEPVDWALIARAREELLRAQSVLLSDAVGLDTATVVRFTSVATTCALAAANVQSALTVRDMLPSEDGACV